MISLSCIDVFYIKQESGAGHIMYEQKVEVGLMYYDIYSITVNITA